MEVVLVIHTAVAVGGDAVAVTRPLNPGQIASCSTKPIELNMKSNKTKTDEYTTAALTAARVRSRQAAKRHGLSSADRDDIEQEMLLDLIERQDKFDSKKSKASTFTGLVTKNRSTELVHKLISHCKVFTVASYPDAANDPDMRNPIEEYSDAEQNLCNLDHNLFTDSMALHDLGVAMNHMSSDQVDFLDFLCTHSNLPSAAKASGMSSATFYRRTAEIEMHLRMFGIRPAA